MKSMRTLVLVSVFAQTACGGAPDGESLEGDGETQIGVQTEALSGGSEILCPPEAVGIGKTASEYLGYYANAKDAVEILTFLGEVIGIFEREDPNAPFNALKNAVQQTGRAIDWKNTMLFIDDKRGKMIWAVDRLVRTGGVLVEGANEDQSSGEAADAVLFGSPFLRPQNDAATDGAWKGYIRDRATPDSEGLVYDWRLGAPALLELIGHRLHIIAAMDPNFRWNDRYDDELERFRASLEFHYGKMLDGIRCGTPLNSRPLPYYSHVCADIHTGGFAGKTLGTGPSPDAPETITARLRSEVRRAMPLFSMRKMIDTLTLYINGQQDLSQATGEIRLSQAFDLCLDVQGGSVDWQASYMMAPCVFSNEQWWAYDRPSGDIFNPVTGLCLDVANADPIAGTRVSVYGCHGGDNQKWSYNPDTHLLENGLGTVLYAQSHARNPTTEPGLGGAVGHAIHMAIEMGTVSASASPPISQSPVVTVAAGGSAAGRQWAAMQTCSNVCTEQSSPMQNGCGSCAESICAADSFCCNVMWDALCVDEVTSICGLQC